MTQPPHTEEVAPGVHRVTDGLRADLVNLYLAGGGDLAAHQQLYLVEASGRLTVLDTGWPRSWATVRAAIEELGRTVRDGVKWVRRRS